jgi:hypothetical protein
VCLRTWEQDWPNPAQILAFKGGAARLDPSYSSSGNYLVFDKTSSRPVALERLGLARAETFQDSTIFKELIFPSTRLNRGETAGPLL